MTPDRKPPAIGSAERYERDAYVALDRLEIHGLKKVAATMRERLDRLTESPAATQRAFDTGALAEYASELETIAEATAWQD